MTDAPTAHPNATKALAWVEGYSAGSIAAPKLDKIRDLDPEAYDRGYEHGKRTRAKGSRTLHSDHPGLD